MRLDVVTAPPWDQRFLQKYSIQGRVFLRVLLTLLSSLYFLSVYKKISVGKNAARLVKLYFLFYACGVPVAGVYLDAAVHAEEAFNAGPHGVPVAAGQIGAANSRPEQRIA